METVFETLDWVVLGIYFFLLIGVAVWVVIQKNKNTEEFVGSHVPSNGHSRVMQHRSLGAQSNLSLQFESMIALAQCLTPRFKYMEPRAEDRGHWITHPRLAYSVAAT